MRLKRLISAFIACAMLVTFMPMQAFAVNDAVEEQIETVQLNEELVESDGLDSAAPDTLKTHTEDKGDESIALGESKGLSGTYDGVVHHEWDSSDPQSVSVRAKGIFGFKAEITAKRMSTNPVTITHKYRATIWNDWNSESWEVTVTPPAAKFFVSKAAGNEPGSGADQGQDNYYPNAHDTIEVDDITYDERTGLPGSLTEKGYELLQDNAGEYFALGGETPIDDRLVIEPEQKFMNALYEKAELQEDQDIVWYVMKDQKDGYHVDGYVSNIPVTVTYKTGYPEASGIENKTFKNTDAFTGSYSLLSPEACGFSPSGYTFTGWKLENSETDKTYKPNTSFELTKAETFVAQWEKDEESDGSTAAYFYVLKPDFSGDPSTATPENFYYVGQGSIENPHAGEADGQQYTKPQEPVTDLLGDIAAKVENIVWYRVGQANGANSNNDTPIVSAETKTWHVDGYLTAPLTVQAVDENNSMLEVTDWPKSESVRVGTEYTVVVGKDNNATIEVPQTITVDGRHYAYDAPKQEEQNGDPLSGEMQLNGATVKIPYAPDNNDNGKPDILEDTYTLTFDANGGKIGSQNLYEDPKPYWSGDVATLAVVEPFELTAPDKAVLIGWSKEDTEEHIYTANDPRPLPQTVSEVRFEDQDITLYAVWGEDSDGDGNPDITEEKYTLQYDANGGTGVPNNRAGLLLNQLVTLDEGATMHHDDVDGKAVVFVGWSTNRENKIFGKNDAAPEIVSEVTIKANESLINTVYAVWGYDENNDGKPDVTEGQYLVSYAWTGAPEGVPLPAGKRYLAYTDVPVDSPYTKDTVVKGVQDGVKGFYTFSGWSTQDVTITADNQFRMPEKDVTLNGTWTFTKDENGGGGAHHPDARDDDDDDNDRDDEDDTEESIDEEVPLAETLWLNTEDHYAYIVGYSEDGTVRPNANITRAEVATIFFRLLTDEARDQFWMTTNNFSDVLPNDWYNNAVSTMVNMGIIQGYEDGTFRPNANITRAEFAAIAARFMSSGYDVEEDLFTDIANHWARESINDAAMAGWINGYEDGTFRPDAAITRAEAVTLVNNVLQRKPDADHMFDSMIKWPDNPESAWYYEAIQEATNSHDYDLFEDAEYETWTALQENRDWAALEKDWVNTHRTGGEVA